MYNDSWYAFLKVLRCVVLFSACVCDPGLTYSALVFQFLHANNVASLDIQPDNIALSHRNVDLAEPIIMISHKAVTISGSLEKLEVCTSFPRLPFIAKAIPRQGL